FTPSDAFESGNVVMVCNGSMTGFAEVASVSGQTVTFADALDFDPPNTEGAAPGSASIARFRNATWQLAGGAPVVPRNACANQQVATGLQILALPYHQFSGGYPSAFVASPAVSHYVDAARVNFQIRAEAAREVDGSATTITPNAAITG